MSSRDYRDGRGYDDPYGYKSKERADRGHRDYYRKEKKYHDDNWRADRAEQLREYDNNRERFERGSTAEIKKKYKQYWPRYGDSKEFKTYLVTQRTGLFDPPSRYTSGEPKRREATWDNRHADRDRRENNISSEDFGYSSKDPQRTGYKTARNARDNPLDLR
jgi:hypothetical protein